MKFWLFSVIVTMFLAGCATDRFYEAGKTIYVAGKKVVVANWDTLPEDVKEKLKKVDEVATKYDETRKVVKPAIEEARKKLAGGDLNETESN